MKATVRLVDYLILVFCIVVYAMTLPGMMGVPIYVAALFFMIAPGYAFTRVFFPNIHLLEKAFIILGFGIAVPTFLIAALTSVLEMIGMVGIEMWSIGISILLLLDALTTILIFYVIMRRTQ